MNLKKVISTRSQNTLSSKIKTCNKAWKSCYNTYFYDISLSLLRPTFFNIYNLPFYASPNIRKIRAKVMVKSKCFSYFMSFCINRIAVFNDIFELVCIQPQDKENRFRYFLLFKYFLNNLLLTVFIQNTLPELVELLE